MIREGGSIDSKHKYCEVWPIHHRVVLILLLVELLAFGIGDDVKVVSSFVMDTNLKREPSKTGCIRNRNHIHHRYPKKQDSIGIGVDREMMSSSLPSSSLPSSSSSSTSGWSVEDEDLVRKEFHIWPLDEYNIDLLNEVHPKQWPPAAEQESQQEAEEDEVYDLIAVGAGAGGLVSSRQTARRGGRSAMISAALAGGDCLNVGCVPSKALIRVARMIREVRLAQSRPDDFGVRIVTDGTTASASVEVDFPAIMKRMRKLRAQIAPVDGHQKGTDIGVDVFQGFGSFLSPNSLQVIDPADNSKKHILKFKKAVIATGGKPYVPDIPGLSNVDYTTNETLFNLSQLPKHMVIIGAGVIALEMAQTFATFGSKVTILSTRSNRLFPNADPDISSTIQSSLQHQNDNITFLFQQTITNIHQKTKQDHTDNDDTHHSDSLPNIQLTLSSAQVLDCDCLLVATGRVPNVKGLNLQNANVQYDTTTGIIVNDYAQSVSNPNVYSVGDCTAGVPRLTHMSGEMAKLVVQNALFQGQWKLSSLVVPATMYTEPEYASVGIVNSNNNDVDVDVYSTTLEHVDRAILDGDNQHGLIKVFCQKNTGIIVGCAIVAPRAGDMINEVTLAMKHNITLQGIGRNIHCYPTTGEAIMSCGLQLINSQWKTIQK